MWGTVQIKSEIRNRKSEMARVRRQDGGATLCGWFATGAGFGLYSASGLQQTSGFRAGSGLHHQGSRKQGEVKYGVLHRMWRTA